ncbi:MFS transporter [Micromonospora eburnea]|uniref:Drug resistance transporter, EmrB/QacA subfamily n=1 Tax=Micromonospora eburnea TaxID=227316 RepID=A0A1C6VK03_9ACTN|nr:MFS transporter [Micromonospora eburnea]SCL66592.1 drug resistance transporter, EmrB/QacA subfamily [Micromonospora eburnea]
MSSTARSAVVPGRPPFAAATLTILAIAQFLIALDYSIVYIALPRIGAEFNLTESSIQWVVSGYAVFFAGFLIVGGRASDRFGPRNLFIVAMAAFGIAALAGGLATAPAMLLAARAMQGIAAAALQPAVIALINTSFAAGPARNRALGVWGTVGASGLAAGVVLGGLLSTVSWRWVLLINLPLALICAMGAPRLLPRLRPPTTGRNQLNVPSAILCTGTVLSTTLALTWASSDGWTYGGTLAMFVVAAVLLVGFVLRERSSDQPLVDPLLRRTRSLLVGCGATALYMASVGNQFFVLTLLLQQLRGYGPIAAGMAFLPMAVAIAVANSAAPRIVSALGVRLALALAFVGNATGLLLLAVQVHGESYVLHLLPGLLITGFAHGVTYVSMFIAGTADVDDRNQGVGSALMTTSQYMAGALGIAVLVLVLGTDPDPGRFGAAFLTTALAAGAGAVLALLGLPAKRTKDAPPVAGGPAEDAAARGPEPAGGRDAGGTGRPADVLVAGHEGSRS